MSKTDRNVLKMHSLPSVNIEGAEIQAGESVPRLLDPNDPVTPEALAEMRTYATNATYHGTGMLYETAAEFYARVISVLFETIENQEKRIRALERSDVINREIAKSVNALFCEDFDP